MSAVPNKITKVGNPNLPFGYIVDFLLYLRKTNHCFLTYQELTRSSYLDSTKLDDEYRNWHLKHLLSPNRFVLIHYDIDANVDIMHELIRFHVKHRIPASCTIFNKRIFDSEYKKNGNIVYDDTYELDFPLLKAFIDIGGCVGYHCNAAERSNFNLDLVRSTIRSDLNELTRSIPISYLTMHGGPIGSNGLSNSCISNIDDILNDYSISWVHNGQSLSFDYLWDDGSAGRPSYKLSIGDPALIASLISAGQRARFLFHPQYYKSFPDQSISHIHQQDYSWYQGVVKNHTDTTLSSKLIYHSISCPQHITLLSNFKLLLKRIFSLFSFKVSRLFPFHFFQSNATRQRNRQILNSTVHSGFLNYFESQVSAYEPLEIKRSDLSILNTNSKSIFIHGMSRSGTTLLCSILNSHPDFSMGYELYPSLLSKSENSFYDCLEILFYLRNLDHSNIFNQLHALGLEKISRFAACVGHSGLSVSDLADVLWYSADSKLRIVDESSAMMLFMKLSSVKCSREGKNMWGAKASGNPSLYKTCFPNSAFVYIVRDPRSIYFSQKNNGSFNPDLVQLYNNWIKKYERFLRIEAEGQCIVVKYEDLILNAEKVLRRICDFSRTTFSESMLSHSQSSNTLHINPRGQLSAERVAKPIDQSSLYAWKKLPESLVHEFDSISNGTLESYWADI